PRPGPRRAAADPAAVAGRRFRRAARTGSELRGDLPHPPPGVSGGGSNPPVRIARACQGRSRVRFLAQEPSRHRAPPAGPTRSVVGGGPVPRPGPPPTRSGPPPTRSVAGRSRLLQRTGPRSAVIRAPLPIGFDGPGRSAVGAGFDG